MDYLKKIAESNLVLPSLILLDLNMPLKSGKIALKEIKEDELFRKIPVIVFSTSGNETVIDSCYALGANTYIIKPISFEKLLKVIEHVKLYWIQTASLPL